MRYLFLILMLIPVAANATFPTDWERRCRLTIQPSKVPDDLDSFTVMLDENIFPAEMFGNAFYSALNNGEDIRFSSDRAGDTRLACEIVEFDTAAGTAQVYVKVPSVSGSVITDIFVWYHKAGETQPAEDAAYGSRYAWDTWHKGVWHFEETDPSSDSVHDASHQQLDGQPKNMESDDDVAGQVGNSFLFGGTNEYIDLIDYAVGTDDLTVMAWIGYVVSLGHDECIWASGLTGDAEIIALDKEDAYVGGVIEGAGAQTDATEDGSTITWTEWRHFATVFDRSANMTRYFDGAQTGTEDDISGDEAADLSHGNGTFIGAFSAAYGFFQGRIDELRISNTVRSAAWVAAVYNNTYDPATFVIEDNPESMVGGIHVWMRLTTANADSSSGDSTIFNPKLWEEAVGGTDYWCHGGGEETHYGVVNLLASYDIVKVRGRSNTIGDPTDVDVYIAPSGEAWGAAVATGITTWQDDNDWSVVDVTDKTGQYVKFFINDTEDANNVIKWGDKSLTDKVVDVMYTYEHAFGHGDYEVDKYGIEGYPTGASYLADSTGVIDSVNVLLETTAVFVDSTFKTKGAIYDAGGNLLYSINEREINIVTFDDKEETFLSFIPSETANITAGTRYQFVFCANDTCGSNTMYLRVSTSPGAPDNDSLVYGNATNYWDFPADPLSIAGTYNRLVSIWVARTVTPVKEGQVIIIGKNDEAEEVHGAR